MYAVNSRDAVFKRHKNFLVQTDATEAGLELGMFKNSLYSEVDCFYTEDDYSTGSELYVFDTFYSTSTIWYREWTNAGSEIYVNFYAMTEDEKNSILPGTDLVNVVTDGSSLGEKLLSVVDNRKGTVTVTTGMPIEKSPDFSSGVPEKWKGATMEYASILDAQSLELIRSVISVVNKGKRIQLYSQTISFDVEPPDGYASLKEFAAKVENKSFNPTKKLTAIYNPGTEQEEFVCESDTSFTVRLVYRDGYTLYNDPEGKDPVKNLSGNDVTVYLIKKASSAPTLD